jgi:hypothetical protein
MLAAALAVRHWSVPSGRYGQVVATAASIKVGAYALGAAATGPVTAVLPPRGVRRGPTRRRAAAAGRPAYRHSPDIRPHGGLASKAMG